MKKLQGKWIAVVLILSLVWSCAACGSSIDSLGLMPKRVTEILSGGAIPEGSEASAQAEEPEYDLPMLWGTWVLEAWNDDQDFHVTDRTVELPDEYSGSITFEMFPAMLTFSPAWTGITLSTSTISRAGRGLVTDSFRMLTAGTIGMIKSEADPKEWALNDPFGMFMESQGYGLAGVLFRAPKKVPRDFNFFSPAARKAAYCISGNQLALGITNEAGDQIMGWDEDNCLDETDILELDFEMKLEGCRLTLTNGKETAVYIPLVLAENGLDTPDMPMGGLLPGYDPINGIVGVSLDPEDGAQMMGEDVHVGYEPAKVVLADDGKADLTLPDGTTLNCDYYYSGDALTLIRNGVPTVYSLFERAKASQNERVSSSFYGPDNASLGVGKRVSYFKEQGFDTNLDLEQEIPGAQTTEAFAMRNGGAEITVKATNPYSNAPAPLRECIVTRISLRSLSGGLEFWDQSQFGKTSMEQIRLLYEAPYAEKDNVLQYKARRTMMFDRSDAIDKNVTAMIKSLADGTDAFLFEDIDYTSNPEIDAYYLFSGGVLNEVVYELPALLYYGLQDNLSAGQMSSLDSASIEGVIQKRNTIRNELIKAFAEANIDVKIDEQTGEISMKNEVLFDTDQYEISEEGKQYIDQFMRVFAGVITRPDLSGDIEAVMFEGHTDSQGSYDYNLTLSQKRAEAVLRYCIESEANGLDDAQRMQLQSLSNAEGYSFSDPIYDSEGNEDMDASRRVAIKFFLSK